jgi:hypothetical protein
MTFGKFKKIDRVPVKMMYKGNLVNVGTAYMSDGEIHIEIDEEEIVGKFEGLAKIGQIQGFIVGLEYRT